MERRRPLHRRRLHVLVRRPLQQQGHRAVAHPRLVSRRQARPDGESRRHHHPLRIRRPPPPVPLDAGRRHPDRRRPGRPAIRQRHVRRLCPGPLPQAIPAEILLRSRGQPARPRGRLRQLGPHAQGPPQLGNQHRTTHARALEDHPPDQLAGLGAGAQPILLRRRHRRQPAALYRHRGDDAGAISTWPSCQ